MARNSNSPCTRAGRLTPTLGFPASVTQHKTLLRCSLTNTSRRDPWPERTRTNLPTSCLGGFKKLLSHAVKNRVYDGRRTLVLQRHRHHTGHDLIYTRPRQNLSRSFGYLNSGRLDRLAGLKPPGVSRPNLRFGVSLTQPRSGRLAHVGAAVESFGEPGLSRHTLTRGLRHARQALNHSPGFCSDCASLRANFGPRLISSPAITADPVRWWHTPGRLIVVRD